MKWLTFISIFAVFGLNSSLNGQAQKNPKRFYIQNPDKKEVRVPFKLYSNLIVLNVFVNGSDTLNFILDSGISNTIITDMNLATSLNMQFVREIKMFGFGNGEAVTARHATENTIIIPGIAGQHQDIIVIPDPDIDFSKLVGIKVHGLLGYNLFRDFIVDINYETSTLTFYAPKNYTYKTKKNSLTLPLTIIDTKPFITTQVMQEDSSVINGRFLIDTGASFALWFDLYSNPNIILPQKTETLYMGTGFSGAVYGKVGRIREFGTGTMKLKNVITSYSDTTLISPSNFPDNRNGSIGADILSRYNIIFDYRNNKITLRPNSKFKEPFTVNNTGMEICCPTPGENLYSISNICNNSPAQKAGLKTGDQILLINSQELSKMTLSEVHSILLKKQGKKMSVMYIREGKINNATLYLNSCI